MLIAKTIAQVRWRVAQARKAGKTIGFVPTMGALHEGHRSLMRAARREAGCVVISIFVNPAQFDPSEDYRIYPRTLEADLKAAEADGVDLVFMPSAAEMYGLRHATYVVQEGLTEKLCGLSRPGHFHGVCTVVAKLLNIAQPDIVYFGQKDYQQTVVIRRMVKDLNFNVQIRVLPTVRQRDGMAMSSRNRHLGPEDRRNALCLHRALKRAQELVRKGERSAEVVCDEMTRIIRQTPNTRVDYVAIVHPATLADLKTIKPGAVAALAVWVNSTRLIDNAILGAGGWGFGARGSGRQPPTPIPYS